jgi:Zn finger protein HypA/HybF involved in hydrogenase expression
MNKYTKDILEPVIKDSKSWAEVCRKFQVTPATGTQSHIKSKARKLQIDFSHFVGQGWSKGTVARNKRNTEYFLVEDGAFINSAKLLKRLIKEGLKEKKCEMCGLTEWIGYEIPLELDHKNNKHTDNRLENLAVLCPTCHALRHRLDKLASVVK